MNARPKARLSRRIHKQLSDRRRTIAFVLYAAIVVCAYFIAFLLRFEFSVPADHVRLFFLSVGALVAIRLGSFHLFRLTRERWRYVSARDVARLAAAVALGTLVVAVLDLALPLVPRVPLSVVIMEAGLTGMLIGGMWLTYRLGFEQMKRNNGNSGAKRVLIIGAGEAGNLLAREMLRFPTGYRLVGFLDDAPGMWGASLHGIEVIGSTEDLATIAEETDAQEIIIAIPSATPAALRTVVRRCEETGLKFRVLPGIAQVLAGDVSLNQLREVMIEDLLGREPIKLELPELADDLRDQIVLITGAAGSIGSELARQVALHSPRQLILFDQAETEMFYLELDLRGDHPDLHIVPIIGDIVDEGAVESVFTKYQPDQVFHAAAYKHVPMMECNPREAIRNNVIGTWRVADAAGRHGAGKFVLVSTDKAVRPSSVMGATKRLAELTIIELQDQFCGTAYGAVRFGNVLGSNGSVIPVFKRQIREGKPLTVTHPETTRYFMTIPEAVQLILQASLLPELRGRIAMLDMGEPVRITDLANNLLRLAGVTDAGRQIVFTGLRPGEKLHEELAAPDEETIETSIAKVRILTMPVAQESAMILFAPVWERLFMAGQDHEVIETVTGLFPDLDIGPIGGDVSTAPMQPSVAAFAIQS